MCLNVHVNNDIPNLMYDMLNKIDEQTKKKTNKDHLFEKITEDLIQNEKDYDFL